MRSTMVLMAVLALAACRKETPPRAEGTQPPRTVTTTVAGEPVDLTGRRIEFATSLDPDSVSRCRAGSSVAASGFVETPSATYTTGDTIFVSMWLIRAPEMLNVSVRALDEDGEVVSTAVRPAAGEKAVTLTLAPLRAGKYRLEAYWGGNLACADEIEVRE